MRMRVRVRLRVRMRVKMKMRVRMRARVTDLYPGVSQVSNRMTAMDSAVRSVSIDTRSFTCDPTY